MVGTDRSIEAGVIQRLDNFIHIEAAVAGKMCCFFKVIGAVELEVAYMGEVDTALEGADHIRKIIIEARSIGTGAERNAVMDIIHCMHDLEDVCLVVDDAGKTEDGPCRIIRMDCHFNIVLVAYRHDCLQEVDKIIEQSLRVHILVESEQFLHMGKTLRLPARHHGAVHITCDGIKHLLWIDGIHGCLHISKYRGAVRTLAGKLGTGPVENRHEVVADKMNIFFAKVLQRLDVVFDIGVAARGSGLDGIGDVDALDAADMKTGSFHFLLEGVDLFLRPQFSWLLVIQRRNDAGNARDLTDLFQGNGVKFTAIPAKCHFHSLISSFSFFLALVLCSIPGFIPIDKVAGNIAKVAVSWKNDGMKQRFRSAFQTRQYMLSKDYELYYYSDTHFHTVDVHSHDYYEFYFPMEGDIEMEIRGKRYPMSPSNVILIPPGVAHRAIVHSAASYRRFVFWISKPYVEKLMAEAVEYGYILQRAVRGEQYIYSFSGDAMIEMHQLLLRILEEIHSSSYARDSYIAVLIQQLLLDINRGAYAETHVDENEREADLLERLLAYIDSHLDEDLTLDQIADDLYVSKYYASHVVKQQIGLSLHQYILQKRLRQCALELAQGRPVTKVYLAHGFHDYSSFFRAFKKMYSLPPKDYQDVYQKDPARLDAVD